MPLGVYYDFWIPGGRSGRCYQRITAQGQKPHEMDTPARLSFRHISNDAAITVASALRTLLGLRYGTLT